MAVQPQEAEVAKCISCMEREGDPKNGGLCYVCAPPLKAVVGRLSTITIKIFPVYDRP